MSMLDRFRLDGKTALVTGAASGLGAAIAVALAESGATVACHGNRRPAVQTCETIRSLGFTAYAFSGDLGEPDGAVRLFGEVQTALGDIHILVNNAGMIHREAAEEFDPAAWSAVLQVNLTSAFRLCQLAGVEMLKRQQGKIINIASLLSFQGGIRVPAYAASKGAIAQLTKALRMNGQAAMCRLTPSLPAISAPPILWDCSRMKRGTGRYSNVFLQDDGGSPKIWLALRCFWPLLQATT